MTQKSPKLKFAVVSVDAVVFSVVDEQLVVLTTKVDTVSHYTDMSCLPGGIIKPKETTDEAVQRILKDKTNVVPSYFEQLSTFSEVNRDKRGRVVSVAHIAFMPPHQAELYSHPGAEFVPVNDIADLAYDHNEMLQTAINRLRGKLTYTTIARYLLPRHFTLTELQAVFEMILIKEFDKRNFRKKMLALDIIHDTGNVQEGVKNRPALLYTFKTKHLTELSLMI